VSSPARPGSTRRPGSGRVAPSGAAPTGAPPRAATLLALDASSGWCSAALAHDGRLAFDSRAAGHSHSRMLLPMIHGLLADAGLRLSDCDAIAFGAGPGAFTGLRIACGVAQGLAFGAGLPVVPVDCVAAAAEHARQLACVPDARPVAVALDARMGEVYFALVAAERPGVPLARLAAPARAAEQLLASLDAMGGSADAAPLAAGDGFERWPEPLAAVAARCGQCVPQAHARADAVARLALRALAAGLALPPAQAAPLYVRDKVALDVDEQRALRAARAAATAAGG
jgi:tRNA threonylcarbamoyladenosine biosynthesis protein TsaB